MFYILSKIQMKKTKTAQLMSEQPPGGYCERKRAPLIRLYCTGNERVATQEKLAGYAPMARLSIESRHLKCPRRR